MRKRWIGIAVAALALLAPAGPGHTASDVAVTAQVFQFKPGSITVEPGTRVVWTNRDVIRHTVTSGVPGQPTGRFDLSLSGPGTTGSVEFTARGVHPYFCARHPQMRGEIRVEPVTRGPRDGPRTPDARTRPGAAVARLDTGAGF
jgi:plastocyanin